MITINFSSIYFGQSFLPIDPTEWTPTPSPSPVSNPSPFFCPLEVLQKTVAVACSNVKRPPEDTLQQPTKIVKKKKSSKNPVVPLKYYKYDELKECPDQIFIRYTGVAKERFQQLANILRENSYKQSAYGYPQMIWTTILNIKYKIKLEKIIENTQKSCEKTLQNYIKHTWVCLTEKELEELGCKITVPEYRFLGKILKNKRNGSLVSPYRRPIESTQNP